ncbi:hypothetical protein LINPERPRIM_LOCUS5669 [Linum perenne]
MEDEPNILQSLLDDDGEDVEMVDVEEGELLEQADAGQTCGGTANGGDGDGDSITSDNHPSKKKRKRNRKKKKQTSGPRPIISIDRFVQDTCWRLKEKKSYLVYTAVGILGLEVLSDLVREVDAIRSCGGQMTSDGKRNRTGGGILWNILKTREPAAYKEIMKKATEFEKQFKQQKATRPAAAKNSVGSSNETAQAVTNAAPNDLSNGTAHAIINETPNISGLVAESQLEKEDNGEMKRRSVHERIRVPVSYEDLIQDDDPKDSCTLD